MFCFVFLPRGVWDLSSPNRAQSCIPSTGRWGLKHWTAREVHSSYYFNEQATLPVLAIYLWKYAYTAMNFSLKPKGLSHPCTLFDIIYIILATLCSRYCSSIPILHRRKWKHGDVKYFSHGHTAWKWQSQDLNSDHGALPGAEGSPVHLASSLPCSPSMCWTPTNFRSCAGGGYEGKRGSKGPCPPGVYKWHEKTFKVTFHLLSTHCVQALYILHFICSP